MRFALLLYCATVPAEPQPAYDCVTVSLHPDAQTAINAAHEWCLWDHLCVHHTYLQEMELGDVLHHVGTGEKRVATPQHMAEVGNSLIVE